MLVLYELGNVKSVNENNYNYHPLTYWKNRGGYTSLYIDMTAAAPTTILPSDLTLTTNVHMVFEVL